MEKNKLDLETLSFSLSGDSIIIDAYVDYSFLYKEDAIRLIEFLQQNLEKLSDDRN